MSKIERDTNSNKIFLKIVDGGLKQKAAKGIPEAVEREWTAGGESGTVWEIPHKAVYGKITNVSFYEGEKDGRKFRTLNIQLDENENGNIPIIAVGIDTKYAQEILKRLPNVNFDEEVRIRPYSFLPENEDKNIVGVELTQRDTQGEFKKKVDNYFYDAEKKASKNGYPIPPKEKDEMTNKDWRRFFEDANDFVIEYIKENVCPRFTEEGKKNVRMDAALDSRDDIDPKDIPF